MLKKSRIPTGQTLENVDFGLADIVPRIDVLTLELQPAIENSRIETLSTGRGSATPRGC